MSEEHNSYRPRKRTCQEEDAETEFEDFKRESRRARTLQRYFLQLMKQREDDNN